MPRPGLPKLIATDLDGTLVRSDDSVSAYSHEVLERVRAAGIPVVGATGRGPRLLDLSRRDLPMARHMVLAGGGHVVDLTDGEPAVLRDQRLDGPVVAALINELEAVAGPLLVMVEALDGRDASLWGDVDPGWPWPERVAPMTRVDSLTGPIIKAFVRSSGEADALLRIAEAVIPPSKASVTQAGLGYVEICPPGVDKATGLAVVAETLGVDPAEVLVFGDMPNDVPMFRWAGWHRVAVGNAHPEVRALADEVTVTNDEDGVAAWLDRLLSSATGTPPIRDAPRRKPRSLLG
jgi:Cof subfamily protein (haloacid dehalogenase superfamily)